MPNKAIVCPFCGFGNGFIKCVQKFFFLIRQTPSKLESIGCAFAPDYEAAGLYFVMKTGTAYWKNLKWYIGRKIQVLDLTAADRGAFLTH